MGQEVLKKFDRYFLLDRIAQGGMAEIFRARLATSEGAGKFLVIKRILGNYGNNAEFRQMFKQEIKVMMGFNNPHIVQLYDFGEVEGQPYIAMEYVDGKNLRQYINRYRENKKFMPISEAAMVFEQVAAGLNYAHTFKDKITGEALEAVHRDISPQNILLSYEGTAKVIDFGIAKATTNTDSTRVGVIKGKPSYLSPEQIAGEKLDGRSDLFALGSVFWECLAGRKLFEAKKGDNEFAVLKLIESAHKHVKPPSRYNKDVPEELDRIVLKMLQRKREDRYNGAEELRKDLRIFLSHYSPQSTQEDLAKEAKEVFSQDILNDRKRLQRLNGKAEQLLDNDFTSTYSFSDLSTTQAQSQAPDMTGMSPSPDIPKTKETETFVDARGNVVDPTGSGFTQGSSVILTPEESAEISGLDVRGADIIAPDRPSRLRPLLKWGGLAAALAGVYLVVGEATLKRTWNQVSKNVLGKIPSLDIPLGKNNGKSDRRSRVLLRLNIQPKSTAQRISLNSQALNPKDPRAWVSLDQPLELIIQDKRFRYYKRQFVLRGDQVGDRREWVEEVRLEPYRYGFLTLYSQPGADVVIKSVRSRKLAGVSSWKVSTPIEKLKLPAGTYKVQMKNATAGLGKSFVVRIREKETVKRIERLEAR